MTAPAAVVVGVGAERVAMDATREEDVARLFDRAMAPGEGFEPADIVVSNAGNNQRIDFRALTARQFEDFWRVASLGGKPGFAHFAAAKAGLRMVAQSMAREYGPQGLHIAHVVIDGGIDGERLHRRAPELIEKRGDNGLLGIDAIAEAYWQIHRQARSAWTQELDL